MLLDPHQAVRTAREAMPDADLRQRLEELERGRLVEAHIGPVVRALIGRWQATEGTASLTPLLLSILLLEGLRVALAIDLLQGLSDPAGILGLTPEQVERLPEDGLAVQIPKETEAALRFEVARLRQEPRGSSAVTEEGGALLLGMVDDCSGPLGAVYQRISSSSV